MRIWGALTRRPRLSDVVLAGAFLAVSLVQVLWIQPVHSLWLPDSSWFGPVFATISLLPLAWRRVHPAAAATVGSSMWWIPTDAFLFLGYVCGVLLFFSVGRWCSSPRRAAAAALWAIASGTAGFLSIEREEGRLIPLLVDIDVRNKVAELALPGVDALLGIAGFWLLVLAPLSIGRFLASEHAQAERRLAAEKEAVRRSAVEEERARIVRELHDVVGHEVTLMAIQSEAAAAALQHAPHRANGPITAVRETAQRASRELRAILDLLGDGELAVAPDRRGLTDLAERAARLGIPNTLMVSGQPWTDAPRHWLAVNRIVQESLTNAGKHACGENVDVLLDWSEDGVRVRVSNSCPTAERIGSGHGLPSMTERARLLGGSLTAAHVDGRFEVDAWLPAQERAPQ